MKGEINKKEEIKKVIEEKDDTEYVSLKSVLRTDNRDKNINTPKKLSLDKGKQSLEITSK